MSAVKWDRNQPRLFPPMTCILVCQCCQSTSVHFIVNMAMMQIRCNECGFDTYGMSSHHTPIVKESK